jgi:hypothetical protein
MCGVFFICEATNFKTRASCKIDCFFMLCLGQYKRLKSLSVPPRFVRWLRESTDTFLFEQIDNNSVFSAV